MESTTEEEINTFVNDRGQKLRRWCSPFEGSPRAICIIIHGVAAHVLPYQSIAEFCWEKFNIATCAFDQVGHGMSEGEKVDILDFQHYVDDLIQFVDIIKSEHAGLPLFAVGHSMGGLVLCHALLRKADLVDGAVMYAAAIQTIPHLSSSFIVSVSSFLSYLMPRFALNGPDHRLTRNKEALEKRKVDPLRYHGGVKIRLGHHIIKAMMEFGPRMSEIKVPVFIAHGTDDKICHVDGSTRLYDTISSTDKTLKTYDKCYHILHVEPDGWGEQFIADICEWMNTRIK